MPNGHGVTIKHDIGHFKIDFEDHSEHFDIFNLGTDWIEISNAVPVDSEYSSFGDIVDKNYDGLSKDFRDLNDVSFVYIFAQYGRMLYQVHVYVDFLFWFALFLLWLIFDI